MKTLFIKAKPSAVLLLLKDSQQSWYPSKLARDSGSSYVHTVNLLSQLRTLGIVTAERKGRQNIYRLTERGAQIASSLDDFSKKCDAAISEVKAAQARQQEQSGQKGAGPPSAQAVPPQAEEKKAEAEKK